MPTPPYDPQLLARVLGENFDLPAFAARVATDVDDELPGDDLTDPALRRIILETAAATAVGRLAEAAHLSLMVDGPPRSDADVNLARTIDVVRSCLVLLRWHPSLDVPERRQRALQAVQTLHELVVAYDQAALAADD